MNAHIAEDECCLIVKSLLTTWIPSTGSGNWLPILGTDLIVKSLLTFGKLTSNIGHRPFASIIWWQTAIFEWFVAVLNFEGLHSIECTCCRRRVFANCEVPFQHWFLIHGFASNRHPISQSGCTRLHSIECQNPICLLLSMRNLLRHLFATIIQAWCVRLCWLSKRILLGVRVAAFATVFLRPKCIGLKTSTATL